MHCSSTDLRPSQWFGGTGHLFQGNRGTKTKFLGEQGNKDNIGNKEHKKTNLQFLGNTRTSQFISGEQGNRYPPGRASDLTRRLFLWGLIKIEIVHFTPNSILH